MNKRSKEAKEDKRMKNGGTLVTLVIYKSYSVNMHSDSTILDIISEGGRSDGGRCLLFNF